MKHIAKLSVLLLTIMLMLAVTYEASAKALPDVNETTTQSIQTKLKVKIDPRVELMSVIFHLAGNPEYNSCRSKVYMKNLNEHFAEHRDHPVVKLAARLRKTRGVSFDAVMGMAIHIKDINSCAEMVPFNPRPKTLDRRWKIDEAREFLKQCRSFVKDSDFNDFLAKNQTQYQTAVTRFQQLMDTQANLAWFDEFFGPRDDVDFNLIISILNGPSNYGCRVKCDGRTTMNSIIGAWKIDWLGWGNPTFNVNVISTVIHEFSHSYCNPLVDKHMDEFRSFGEVYFPRVEKQMKRQAYSNWRTMMYESLVRVCEVRYAQANGGQQQAEHIANYNVGRGFHWIKDLSQLIENYEQHRDQYPTLESFMPEIVTFFQNYEGPPKE